MLLFGLGVPKLAGQHSAGQPSIACTAQVAFTPAEKERKGPTFGALGIGHNPQQVREKSVHLEAQAYVDPALTARQSEFGAGIDDIPPPLQQTSVSSFFTPQVRLQPALMS